MAICLRNYRNDQTYDTIAYWMFSQLGLLLLRPIKHTLPPTPPIHIFMYACRLPLLPLPVAQFVVFFIGDHLPAPIPYHTFFPKTTLDNVKRRKRQSMTSPPPRKARSRATKKLK